MTQTQERVVKFFKEQFNAFNFETQFGAAVAGVQSGKTFLGTHWAGKKIQEFPKGTGLIVAPTYNILRQATLKKLFDIFPELRQYFKEQKGELELPTGGIVFVRSADKPLGIEGITADWIWGDELGMASILTWTVLRSRVSMTRGQILLTTTPYNMGWLYTDFFMPWKNNEDSSLSFYTWRSIDNPHYSKEYFEAERRRLDPKEFSRRYEGKFEKMTGLIWDLPDENKVTQPDRLAKTDARIIGIDWGFRNPTAIVVLYLKDKKWTVAAEWKQAEKTTKEIVQVVRNMMREHKVTVVYPDPAEPDRIQDLANSNIAVMEAIKDVRGGITYVQQLIKEKRFFVSNDCKETLDEMSMYHWLEPKEGKLDKDEPEKINDHLCDAIRYAIYSYGDSKVEYGRASEAVKPFYPELGF